MSDTVFIGWDVGAWLSKGGDALWVLDKDGNTLGSPWHGNLGVDLQAADSVDAFIDELLSHCGVYKFPRRPMFVLAIDAPLALPEGFVRLVNGTTAPEHLGAAIGNPYLFRATERIAAKYLGRNPLSPLQDQIGSQTTKILHFLAKFHLRNNQDGVWLKNAEEKRSELHVIEAYPAMCKRDEGVQPKAMEIRYSDQLRQHPGASPDEKDALLCAIIALLYATDNGALHQPEKDNDFCPSEGWIWFPKQEAAI